MDDTLSYKQRKEAFVSGCHGTNHFEVFVLTQCLPLIVCMAQALKLSLTSSSTWNTTSVILYEALVILLPLVAICTGLVPPAALFWLLLVLSILSITAHVLSSNISLMNKKLKGCIESLGQLRRPYISLFRGGLMLYTCLCILAVDFPSFPRKYAKAEAYGSGLMDAGVGGIILASGLVSRGQSKQNQETRHLGDFFTSAARKTIPCLLLGSGRFVSVKILGYQQVVEEYGVHWNFFITIAFITLIVHLFPVSPRHTALVALGITCLHQAVLSMGAGAWALGHQRGSDFISQNKEGIVSLAGYYTLFLAGSSLSHHMKSINTRGGAKIITLWLLKWIAIDLALWALTFTCEIFLEVRARRTCNAAYILWTVSLSLSILITFASGQILWSLIDPIRGSKGPLLLTLANKSMLPTFLIANLMTGAVNLCTFDTLSASDSTARLILFTYMLAVSCATVITSKVSGNLKCREKEAD